MDTPEAQDPSGAYAKIIADSIYQDWRLTTFEVRFWRPVLAEMNTHCVFARNSASSRAIPVTKQLAKVGSDPSLPVQWPGEKKGMQGGAELEGQDLVDAHQLWGNVQNYTVESIHKYLDEHDDPTTRLHKSLLNRLIEPWMWQTCVITATSYENFFDQRVSPLAQPELRTAAAMMHALHGFNEPEPLELGDYHLPYITFDDRTEGLTIQELVQISVARCARVSYLTQDGVRDHSKDLEMYGNLTSATPMHASPLEHVATPAPWNSQTVSIQAVFDGVDNQKMWGTLGQRKLPKIGKFPGWLQHRHEYECRAGHTSYR